MIPSWSKASPPEKVIDLTPLFTKWSIILLLSLALKGLLLELRKQYGHVSLH